MDIAGPGGGEDENVAPTGPGAYQIVQSGGKTVKTKKYLCLNFASSAAVWSLKLFSPRNYYNHLTVNQWMFIPTKSYKE